MRCDFKFGGAAREVGSLSRDEALPILRSGSAQAGPQGFLK
jgi:hypothetical protein